MFVRLGRVVVACLLGLASLSATANTGSAEASSCGWTQTRSRNPSATDNFLYGVSGSAASDVWSVGEYFVNAIGHSLAEHWDGTRWRVFRTPRPHLMIALLDAAALGRADAWTVGNVSRSNGRYQSIIEHWNGASWSVSDRLHLLVDNGLLGVSASSSSDVWAVGQAGSRPLVEHWNGQGWQRIPTPVGGEFSSVSALGPDDVWVAGTGSNGALVEHWDGSKFTVAPTVSVPNGGLDGISAISSDNVWAAGLQGQSLKPLVEHWNGTSWSVIVAPSPGDPSYFLNITAVSSNDVWAVGLKQTSQGEENLIEHWNGSSWSEVPEPQPDANFRLLYDVAPVGGSEVWSAGSASIGDLGSNTEAFRYC